MNVKALKTLVTGKTGRTVLQLQKHSPAILFTAGVVGMVGTAVLAARATLKLDEVLDDIDKNKELARQFHEERAGYSDQDYKRDMVVLYVKQSMALGKLYGPAFICGAVSIAALTGSHFILNARNTAMTAAYVAVDKAYREYQERVASEFGEEKARELRNGFETEEVMERNADGTVSTTEKKLVGIKGLSPYAVIFDEKSSSYSKAPHANQFFIQCQQNYANELLRARGHVFLNEVHDMLGLPRTPAGQIVGWVDGKGDDFVSFGVFDGDTFMGQQFANGDERSVVLDFNVAGSVYQMIGG